MSYTSQLHKITITYPCMSIALNETLIARATAVYPKYFNISQWITTKAYNKIGTHN